jgi:hypothetical protein
MPKSTVPFIKVLNAAFDDTLDYWFLCVPPAAYVLLGATVLPNAVRAIDVLPLGSFRAQIAGGLVFVLLVANVLLNVFANFITVAAWNERDRGRVALRGAFDALRGNLWRCASTYAIWFGFYLAYLVALYAVAFVVTIVALAFGPPPAVAIPVYLALAGCALYVLWRLLRLLIAVQYLPAVLALTHDGGRRAVGAAIRALRGRFWLSLLLPLLTFVPALLPDVIAVKADWRLHSFVSCIFGGFFATFGTLVTLRVYSLSHEAAAEPAIMEAVMEQERPPSPALVQA